MTEKTKSDIEFNLNGWKIMIYVLLGFFIIFFFIALFGTLYKVSAGERAVVLRWGEALPIVVTEGLHVKVPIMDEVVKVNIKTQKYEASANAASQDLQTVNTNVAVNYHLEGNSIPTLYKEIGLSYSEIIIQPAVQEVVKAITAQYTAEQLITKRQEVKDRIDSLLRERLSKTYMVVETISITNFEFSTSFNNAIEAKVTAEQNALAEKNKLAQIEYQAQQRVAQAEGEAKAIKAQAEAIKAQGGSEYVQLQAISKWNGQLPNIMMGNDGALPFINIQPQPTA